DSAEQVSVALNIFGKEIVFFVGGRNLGGLVEFYLQYGVAALGLVPFFLYMISRSIKTLFASRSSPVKKMKLVALYAIALWIFGIQYGSTSNPLVWLVLLSGYLRREKSAGFALRSNS